MDIQTTFLKLFGNHGNFDKNLEVDQTFSKISGNFDPKLSNFSGIPVLETTKKVWNSDLWGRAFLSEKSLFDY